MDATDLTIEDVVADFCYQELNANTDLPTFFCCLSYLNNNEHQG